MMQTVMDLFLYTLVTLAAVWVAFGLVLFLMRWLGVGREFLCRIGWHSPPHLWEETRHDGCSQHAVCPWCRYEGMIDSQGNLF